MMTILALAGLLTMTPDAGEAGPDGLRLPTSLVEEVMAVEPGEFVPSTTMAAGESRFSLGAALGYLTTKGDDHGTWFAGAQARFHFAKFFAVEAMLTFHDNRYESGDVHVTQYPFQASAMLYPFPEWQIKPYVLAGFGWYYTRVSYTGAYSSISNETDHTFGGHAGLGGEIHLASTTSIDLDLRYIWINPDTAVVSSSNFDYWQLTAGINFFF